MKMNRETGNSKRDLISSLHIRGSHGHPIHRDKASYKANEVGMLQDWQYGQSQLLGDLLLRVADKYG